MLPDRMQPWRRRQGDNGQSDSPEQARDELLSAYLDGELSEPERARVERQLDADAALRGELAELRAVRDSLALLGMLRAPRPFTIEAQAVRRPARMARAELVARVGAVAAALTFVAVLSGDVAGFDGSSNSEPVVQPNAAIERTTAGDAGGAPVPADAETATLQAIAPESTAAAAEATLEASPAGGEGLQAREGDDAAGDGTADAAGEEGTQSLAPPSATEEAAPDAATAVAGEGAAPAADAAGAAPSDGTPEAALVAPTGTPEPLTREADTAPKDETAEAASMPAEGATLDASAPPAAPIELSQAQDADDGRDRALRVAEAGLLAAAIAMAAYAGWQWMQRRRPSRRDV